MNCTICGKSTMPGAMLCAPCKAALKRARYVTVQEGLQRPSIIEARRPRRVVNRPAVATAEPAALPASPSRPAALGQSLRPMLIGLAAMALLGAVAYFGQQEPSAQSHDALLAVAPPPPAAGPVAVASEANSAPAAVVVSPPPAAPVVEPALPTDAEPPAAHPALPAPKLAASVGGKRALPRSAATFATVNGDPPDASSPPPVPEKVAALPAPPPAPPAPDRWQSMRESIALCDRENLINGIICGQKARIQYCEGYWGKVPQCPGPTLNPER